MEATVMSMYEAKPARKVYLYRNGIVNTDPKPLVVNERQIRDFSTFLTRVTSGLKAPVAIRNIYTPCEGHRVRTLDQLQTGRYYVAGGNEHFRKIKYGSPPRLLPRRLPRAEVSMPPRIQLTIAASARYKRPVEKPFVIHVFRNGDERFRGARLLLPRKIMGSWEHVLQLATEKAELFTPAKRLCTLDGRTVHAASELQDGGKYVVMEGTKPFKKVAYCGTESSPLHRKSMRLYTVPRVIRHRRLRHQPHSQPPDGTLNDSKTTHEPIKPHPPPVDHLKPLLQRRKSRPMAGRKNKEAREKAVRDHREDSIFGGSPRLDDNLDDTLDDTQGDRMPSPPALHLARGEVGREPQQVEVQRGEAIDTLEPVVISWEERSSEEKQPPPPSATAEDTQSVSGMEEEEGEKEGSLVEEELASSKGSMASKTSSSKASSIAIASSAASNVSAPSKSSVASKTSQVSKASSKGSKAPPKASQISSKPVSVASNASRTSSKAPSVTSKTHSKTSASGEGQGVFYASSNLTEPTKQEQTTEYVESSQGESVFKASVQRSETLEAEDVQESREIKVERPVDQDEAQEVEEVEEEEGEGGERASEYVEDSARQPPQDVELESNPLQTTVDLSINRVQPKDKANSHTHSGRDGENTSPTSSADSGGGGGRGGAEAVARGGGGEKEEEEVEEEVTGTQQLELQTEHSKVKPLEDGSGAAGQQVEDGSERTIEVDGIETSERSVVGGEQSEDDRTSAAAQQTTAEIKPSTKSQEHSRSTTGHLVTSRKDSNASGTMQDTAFVIEDPSEQT